MLFIAALLAAFVVGAEVDIFVPAFPELQETFGLTPFYVELVLTLNLVVYGLASFWAGMWGDRYGHKRVTVAGLLLFCIGSLTCWLAPSFSVLLLGRVIQGIGVAAPAVLTYVWLMETYPAHRHVSIVGLMNGIVTFAVAGAPILGSAITLYWGWRGTFAALFVWSVLSWVMCQMCKAPPKHQPQHKKIEPSYREVWDNKFIVYTMAVNTFMATNYYTFVGIAPILYREGLGVSLQDFGWYQGSICFSFAIVSLLSGHLVKWWGTIQCMRASCAGMVIFTIGLIWMIASSVQSPLTITLFMNVFAVSCAIPIALLYPLGLNAMPEAKGKISAMQVATRLGSTALALQVAGYVYDGTFFGVGVLLLVTLIGALWGLERLYRVCNLQQILIEHEKSEPTV